MIWMIQQISIYILCYLFICLLIGSILFLIWKMLCKKMEEKGFVTAYEQAAANGKSRRYYHLTDQGHAALREKEASWKTYARAVGQVLKGGACCAGA